MAQNILLLSKDRCVSPSPSFSTGFVEFPRAALEFSIPHRFEKIVDLNPHLLAVKTKHQELSYADFNRSANRLARAVVGQSSHHRAVAILLEHDAAAIVTIFAVLKAAKYFLPLDPSLPKSRLRYMLEDSEVEILITNDQFFSFARSELGANIHVLNLDAIDASLGSENLEARDRSGTSELRSVHLRHHGSAERCPTYPSK